ncbi:MAG: sulfurtransferase-like selenium metabolism protein YedF [Dethiosulfovibrio peptidovorans]|nr:MAG: sulfurtransferase-like selenium metabolism protein YedF [Dethiosulfovibrio peptidovorans]
MQIVDTRGKPCPEPVILTKKAIERNRENLRVIVDNPVAGQNVSRLLKSKGFNISLEAENDLDIIITGTLPESTTIQESPPQPNPLTAQETTFSPRQSPSTTVLISRDVLGGTDRELGEVLIKGFLGSIHQVGSPLIPNTLALMNEGVRLALKDSSAWESLQELQSKGCRILVCGTCVNHFGVSDQVQVGEISNMFDIAEALLEADKTLTI